MPCCKAVLDIVVSAAAATSTPTWLHRLHTKKGMSFPSYQCIDDLLYRGTPQSQPSSMANTQPHMSFHRQPQTTTLISDIVAECDANVVQERARINGVTIIDTSTNGWKIAKQLIRSGNIWEVHDQKTSVTIEEEHAIINGNRRASCISKLQADCEKEKEVDLEGTTLNSSRHVIKTSVGHIQTFFMTQKPHHGEVAQPKQCKPCRNPIRRSPRFINPSITEQKPEATTMISDVSVISSSIPIDTHPFKSFHNKLQPNTMLPDVSLTPFYDPMDNLPIKAFLKKQQSRLIIKEQPIVAPLLGSHKVKKYGTTKVKKHHKADCDTSIVKERTRMIGVTIIDTSTNGWKTAKELKCMGDIWEVHDKKSFVTFDREHAITKGERRLSLVSMLQRDYEKEKGVDSQGVTLSSGEVIQISDDDHTQTLKRSRCSEAVPDYQKTM